MLLGCNITLSPVEEEDYTITITNDTGYQIIYLQILTTAEWNDPYYTGTPVDVLGRNTLLDTKSIDVYLKNYSSSK